MGREQGRTVGTGGDGGRSPRAQPGRRRSDGGHHLEPRRAADPDDRRPGPCLAQHGAVAAHRGSAHRRPGDAVLGRSPTDHQRDVIVLALGVVVLGSVLAAVSNSFVLLVVGRGLQGWPRPPAGDDGHRPQPPADREGGSHHRHALDHHRHRIGLGYPITSAITELFNYHAAFWFGAFATACALALVALVVPRTRAHDRRFDVIGVVNLSLVVIASRHPERGRRLGWTSLRVLAIGAVCIVLLALWIPTSCAPRSRWSTCASEEPLRAHGDVAGFLICVSITCFCRAGRVRPDPAVSATASVPRWSWRVHARPALGRHLRLEPLLPPSRTASARAR